MEHFHKEYCECCRSNLEETLRNLDYLILKAGRRENYDEELKFIVEYYEEDLFVYTNFLEPYLHA